MPTLNPATPPPTADIWEGLHFYFDKRDNFFTVPNWMEALTPTHEYMHTKVRTNTVARQTVMCTGKHKHLMTGTPALECNLNTIQKFCIGTHAHVLTLFLKSLKFVGFISRKDTSSI